MICQQAIALRPVEVVAIDDGERLLNGVRSHEDCMGCAPGLSTAGRRAESLRKVVNFLEGILDGNVFLTPCGYEFPELLLDLSADHKHNFAKTGPERIIDGIIDDGF